MKVIICLMFFSDSIIFNSSIVYKELGCSISRWETGHYSSVSYTSGNNLFGWRRKGRNLKFKSKYESVLSYQKFEQRIIKKYNIKSEREYLNTINKFYSRDRRWKSKILTIRKRYERTNRIQNKR